MVKRKTPKFHGELDRPIIESMMFPFGMTPGHGESQKRNAHEYRLKELQCAKLPELLDHYKIDPSNDNCWLALSFCLARDFVPGMQVFKIKPRNARPRGKWGIELRFQFHDVMKVILAEHPGIKIRAAAEIAQEQDPDRWGGYRSTTLETRYHELKKMVSPSVRFPVGFLPPQTDED